MSSLACVDLFCGAGGLTYGLRSEGVPVVAGIDIDEACRHPFEENNFAPFMNRDVGSLSADTLREIFGKAEVRIVAGCAPCQPFSTYSQRYDTKGTTRWKLLGEFGRLVNDVLPDVVTMENVPSILRHDVYGEFLSVLRRQGYQIWSEVVDCAAYELPQRRMRMVLLASRLGHVELISPEEGACRTVQEAIGHLPAIEAGCASDDDALHVSAGLTPINVARIKAARPGGSWRDWPEQLVAKCHRRATGKTYPGVYGRMQWDEPAPTLTTQFFGFGNGRFGHPEQDRAISLREGAILQGFPETYSFVPPGSKIHFTTLGRMIGNAVPVTLGAVIGRSIMRHLGMTVSRSFGDGLAVDAERVAISDGSTYTDVSRG